MSITSHINNLDDYKKEVLRTCPAAPDIRPGSLNHQETFGAITNCAMGLAGESGEIIDHIKKVSFQGHSLDQDLLVKELGDVFWYLTLACYCLGMNPMYVIKKNVEKLRKRYPEGFSAERSVNREE